MKKSKRIPGSSHFQMESPLFSCDLFNAGVELRIWLRQGEEKSLPVRILKFQRKRVNVCRDNN